MTTHSSILAWGVPRIEEPGRLQSMVLQRVRHDWSGWAHTHDIYHDEHVRLSYIYTHRYARLSLKSLLNKWVKVPSGSEGKASACSAGDSGSIPGLGRSPGEGNGNPFQYSCLENSMDRGAWWATVHGVTKSRTRLSDVTFNTYKSWENYQYFNTWYVTVSLLLILMNK